MTCSYGRGTSRECKRTAVVFGSSEAVEITRSGVRRFTEQFGWCQEHGDCTSSRRNVIGVA